MKKFLMLIVLCAVVVAGLMGGLYYRYATNTESPYDEIGITLNGLMPGPIRAWGCGKLQENFANQLPPAGCSVADDPTTWGTF